LSEHERVLIGDGLRSGATMTQIGADLGRSTSTITREVHRNSDESGAYRPFAAHSRALGRLPRPRLRRLTTDGALRAVVQEWLDTRWSPEQISHSLRIEHPDIPAWHLAQESIYQGIYDRTCPLALGIVACLRTRRRPRRVPGSRRGGGPRDVTTIDERPSQADDRVEAGHWEGDLITGASNRSAIGTLAERTARYVMLVHLPDNHTAEATSAGVAEAMRPLPAGLRRTLTWHQGSEMAGHVQLAADLGTNIHFCEAHSPWQRPTNENMNGLLRDYFPKGTDLAVHSAERLREVQDELNNRPRKCPNWETPATVSARLQSDHS
jgi:IS30 family transposase